MENQLIKQKYKLKENNSFIYNTPKIFGFPKSPISSNVNKKNIIQKNINQNEKILLKKNPYINFNFNLIQTKNMNNKKIRTITPNLQLREIVNQKFRENNFKNINNLFKFKKELPDNLRNSSQNKNYIHTDCSINKKDNNEKFHRQLKLIFVMKNKINELNKIIKEKNQEIKNLKKIYFNNFDINKQKDEEKENEKFEEEILNESKKEKKNISKNKEKGHIKFNINNNNSNNNYKNKKLTQINKKNNDTEKLTEEIKNLNKIITSLEEKYQLEIKKNKEFKQKYTFIKNCTFGVNVPKVQIDEKIKNYENKIIELEEQIFQLKQSENKNNKSKTILTNEEYSNIQLCLKASFKVNKLKEENILKNIDNVSFENIEKISKNICNVLKLQNNNLISNFINDYIVKNKKNIFHNLTFNELFKYDKSTKNFMNNELFSFIKQRCITYDYNQRCKIPIYYLRHIYNEFCFKNRKQNNNEEFFNIVNTCKNKSNYNFSNNICDIYYNNLISTNNKTYFENGNINDNNIEIIVKKFVDSLMNEELEKYKERQKNKKLLKYNEYYNY